MRGLYAYSAQNFSPSALTSMTNRSSTRPAWRFAVPAQKTSARQATLTSSGQPRTKQRSAPRRSSRLEFSRTVR
jgi:hypothetical protein